MLRQGFVKYLKNTSWLFAERFLRMIIGLSIGLWVARYLGPEQFGMFAYAQSFVALFMAFATLGLDGIVVRELVKYKNRHDDIIGTTFLLKLIGAMVVFCILAIAIKFTTNDDYTNTLVFIIASATIFHSFNVIDFYFQSKVLSKYVVYANVLSLMLASGVKVFLILNEAPLVSFAWVVLFESAVLAIGLLYFFIAVHCNKDISLLSGFKFNKNMAFSLLRESWPLILASIASMINMRIDQVMLSNMAGYEVVGNYAAAVRIAEIWLILPVLIGKSVFPAIISAKSQSLDLYRTRIFSSIKYMSYFAIPFVLIVSSFSSNIIHLLYGSQFSNAGHYLSLYIWTGLPYVVLFSLGQVVLAESLTKWSLYITIVTVVINVTFNYLLIPIYGGVGAIVVTLLAAYIGQAILLLVVYKNTNIFRFKVKERYEPR
ncbi:flippase [Vibrio salilacus]|uniref:flippase n=1 Tax=Vibrio salilacus TaxID=1323749 RepID=UPI000C2A08E7|nr:flippase [Vibrio salilacus]